MNNITAKLCQSIRIVHLKILELRHDKNSDLSFETPEAVVTFTRQKHDSPPSSLVDSSKFTADSKISAPTDEAGKRDTRLEALCCDDKYLSARPTRPEIRVHLSTQINR